VGRDPRRARRLRLRAVPASAPPRGGGVATAGADVPRLLLAIAGAACAAVAATQLSTEATLALAIVLAVVALAKLVGGAVRAVQAAVPAAAAAVVAVVALPTSVAVAATLAAGVVCGALALTRRPAPAPASAPVLEPESAAPEPPPAVEPAPRKLRVSEHEWDVEALARLVDSRANEHPERAEEWRAFLDELRGHAVNGVLPAGFDALVRDVYAPILPADA
jgi:hypothetical protein